MGGAGLIGAILLLPLLCALLGDWFVRRLCPSASRVDRLAMSIGAGLGLIGTLVFSLGICGALNLRAALCGVAVLLVASLVLGRGSILRDIAGLAGEAWASPGLERTLARGLALILVLLGIASAAPPAANDALVYHLEDPKQFVAAGRLFRIPCTDNSAYPYLGEMLFTAGMLAGSDRLAQGFHWTCGVACVLAVYALARRYAERSRALLASAVFLLTPGVANQMPVAYVDVALGMFGALSLLAVVSWNGERRGGGGLFLAGLFAGWAMSVKYNGLIVAATCGVVLVLLLRVQRGSWIALLPFCAGALVALPWYLRTWHLTGNPVYPFAHTIFGAGYARDIFKVGMGKSPLAFLLSPWNVTMHPEHFDGTGNAIGPVYLALLPGLFLWPARMRRAWPLAAAGGCLYAGWFLTGQSARFLIPALPALAALLVLPLRGRVLGGLVAVLLMFQGALLAYYQRMAVHAAIGLESEAAFLRRVERTQAVAPAVAALPSTARLLTVNELRHYHLRPAVEEALYVRYDEGYARACGVGEEAVIEEIRRDGFTHVLWRRRLDDPPERDPTRLRALLSSPLFREAHFEEIAAGRFDADPDDRCTYLLLRLR